MGDRCNRKLERRDVDDDNDNDDTVLFFFFGGDDDFDDADFDDRFLLVLLDSPCSFASSGLSLFLSSSS
jgi:hypothetical protein